MKLVEGKMDRGRLEKNEVEVEAGTAGGQLLPATNLEDSRVLGMQKSAHPISVFEAIIEEIGCSNAINVEHPISDSTGERNKTKEAQGLFVEKRKEDAREA